ncbi:DUF3299 domain-containing protein [Aliiglaciecola sp. CAU 1673]|uniref:DUF3299 domain-containing protein n=1 Tax=Aliiglaciecola sp. CAU 1673 TaxID=3032595 RepID=UPI0023DCBA3E|nr:DUF3299 domain-containing protein [Aliiglaciecola sp. CAU 1673]MDF2179156.1 DUF3299 domain-containing protein [Aliiglaciecola sp. CAU 1673]
MKKLLSLCLFLLPLTSMAAPKELYWEDLAPQDFVMPEQSVLHDGSNMAQISPNAPIVKELDGLEVRIPGFVVPLEGDDKTLTEFLLVPYFGACIHVPPPPANQIVYVQFEKGALIDNLYDAVWITGTLSTQGWSGDIATVGYRLKGIKVEPYEG